MSLVSFVLNGDRIDFEQNISYDCLPEIDLTQGTVTTAAGLPFSFDTSQRRILRYRITWPLLAAAKVNELINWLKLYADGKKNQFIYYDPFAVQHEVHLASDTISFRAVGGNGQYYTLSLELIELETK